MVAPRQDSESMLTPYSTRAQRRAQQRKPQTIPEVDLWKQRAQPRGKSAPVKTLPRVPDPNRLQDMENHDLAIPPPSKEAQEHHTISEDRSAGSNVEMRNLAALKDRNTKDRNVKGITVRHHAEGGSSQEYSTDEYDSEPVEYAHIGREAQRDMSRAYPYRGGSSKGLAQSQQRFGQLCFDQEGFNDHVDEKGQILLEDVVLTADTIASHGQSHSQPLAKHDWAGENQPTNAGKGLQANIESLREKLARTQKELDKLERRKEALANEQFRLIYRIGRTCYFDHPEWTQGYKSIVSHNPVKNLDLFLERNKNIVFIVYRDFDNAPLTTGAKTKSSSPQHIRESIRPVSQRLRRTLLMMLKGDWRYEAMSLELYRKGEIAAPYLFFYHHRASWENLVDRCPPNVRDHLRLLARYV